MPEGDLTEEEKASLNRLKPYVEAERQVLRLWREIDAEYRRAKLTQTPAYMQIYGGYDTYVSSKKSTEQQWLEFDQHNNPRHSTKNLVRTIALENLGFVIADVLPPFPLIEPHFKTLTLNYATFHYVPSPERSDLYLVRSVRQRPGNKALLTEHLVYAPSEDALIRFFS